MTDKHTKAQMRRTNKARNFPTNTCPASRHVHMMAEALARGERYFMFEDEPEHCAVSLLSVLESLWKLRTKTGWPSEKEREQMRRRMEKTVAKLNAAGAQSR